MIQSLFIYKAQSQTVYLLVYVDDIIIIGSSPQLIQHLTAKLNSTFSLKQLGKFDYFFGIEVKTLSDNSLVLTQSTYIRNLLQKTHMAEAQLIYSPMVTNCKLSKSRADIFFDPTLYRFVVGALQNSTISQPEISFEVNKVCQFMSNPLDIHWVAVKRILRYLRGSISHGLHLRPAILGRPLSIQALYDADWAFDVDDRRSTSGVAIYLGPNLVSWWSRKQEVVARSSTEAEYRSLAQATAETLWIQTLLAELGVPFTIPVIFSNN